MRIYCSGIGGIGLSAYAALQNAYGHEVLGSDRTESDILKKLREHGISVSLNQNGTFIPDDIDLFVYSEAIPKDAPERRRAEDLGVKMQSYFEALGELSQNNTVISVCGTHGKSSTVAMAARVLIEAGKDPTVVCGTKLKELDNSNWRKGKSELFLLEACEYRRSFLVLSPDIILMTNVDGDHFDAFDSIEDYQEAFVEFLKKVSMQGKVITHMRDKDCARVSKKSGKELIDADGLPLPDLSVSGTHMQKNAQLVLGLAQALDIPQEKALKALSGYAGCWRRMEVKGEYGDGITVIDDYAHHPREIEATLAAARSAYPGRRLVCVFQPHMHDRTLKLYEDFKKCFSGADFVVITDVYDARSDVETEKVDMSVFAEDIARESHVETIYDFDLRHTESMLKEDILQTGDVLLCLGAGDITQLAGSLVS
ncbi:UDP-N-acetylmuramate--L-alanine ligase [Patescibacteria group bacterium]|nr:UDP-N-acetylmuramate--L-alanine ligase [Patescibacteria group bacterium]MBU2259335.1 UDP-N-acetylmuramate--L-alanine ligase [Patescibacteria group bacterium]